MKNSIVCLFAVFYGTECFAQASATASVSATIIDADTVRIVFNALKVRAVRSKKDTIHVIDSVLAHMNQVMMPKKIVEIKQSTRPIGVRNIRPPVAYPKIVVLTDRQKWFSQVHISVWDSLLGFFWYGNLKKPHAKSSTKNTKI